MKKAITCMTVLLTTMLAVNAQQKGAFNSTINFNNASRTLSYFVPQNYDSAKTYTLMVCLHGLGDNSSNYRDALINAVNWPTVFPQTIFVCPDGGADQNKDFYAPAGDEMIIEASISHASSIYKINPNNIILQGFSLGGRSALKFGLDHPGRFKGLLLSTPAIQDITDLNNTPGTSLIFNYANAHAQPICVSVGKEDYAYNDIVGKLVTRLKKENGAILFESIPGMGHGIADNSFSNKVYPFINGQNQPAFDVEIFSADFQQTQCTQNVPLNVWVYNKGQDTVHNLLIEGTGLSSQTWTGTIPAYHSAMIPLTLTTSGKGLQKINIQVNTTNGEIDAQETDNSFMSFVAVKTAESPTSINADFDKTDSLWSMPISGSMFRWYIDSTVKKTGAASMAMFNLPLAFYTRNNRESIYSPVIDIAALNHKQMSFDLAFNYDQYSPPYVASTTNFADTLEISISTDCGITYTTLYKKGGHELATASAPILNPLSFDAATFVPTAEQWRKEVIDLSAYAGQSQAIFRFTCISGMGGSLYIDNLNAGDLNTAVNEYKSSPKVLHIYPNPATDLVNIQQPITNTAQITIYDQAGRIVSTQSLTYGNSSINTANLANGIYWLVLQTEGNTFNQKLIIQHK